MIVIKGLNMFWKETRNNHIPQMMRTTKGKFKGKNNLQCHCVLLAGQIKSGIPTRRWIGRILYRRCELDKQERVFLFARDNGQKASIGDYNHMFRHFLEQCQKLHP